MQAVPLYQTPLHDAASIMEPVSALRVSRVSLVDQITWRNFRKGDAAAFSEVYKQLFPPVFLFAKQQVPHEIAEDITADLFVYLWQQEKNFDSLQQLKTYLQVAVRNRCTSYYRHEQIKLRHAATALAEAIDSINPLNEIHDNLINRLHLAINQLPAQRRKIFRLAYLESYKEAEIARLLGIKVNTVHNQKVKAMQFLRMHFLQAVIILFLFLSGSR